MKILWIVNTIFPFPAEKIGIKKTAFGGWLNGLAKAIKEENKEIEIAISTVYSGKEIKEFEDEMFKYFLIPGAPALNYDKKLEKYWKVVNDKFKPDLVHINGTEFAHGLAFMNACPEVKTVTSIQGLVSVYEKVYYANICIKDILKNITFRDIIKRDTIIQARGKFIKRGKNEIRILKNTNAISVRTIWDYSNSQAINKNVKFYFANRILRDGFYRSKKWETSKIEKYSIFCSQAMYPIKGLHFMIEAIKLLKNKYSTIKLYVAGNNITAMDNFGEKLKISGYGKYIRRLIKKYDLSDNIIFTGTLNEEKMIERLLKSNVFVQTSSIENSPNSLGEAMLLGVPCVASYVGGTSDMLEHKKEGFLYTYTEPAILAEYIKKIFESEELCNIFSKNAIKKAEQTHDKKRIANETLNMYYDLKSKEN